MKIAMINGSPKLGESNSGVLLKRFEAFLEPDSEITYYSLNKKDLDAGQYSELCEADAIVLAFPLYIDAIPSHLFRMMIQLEEYLKKARRSDLYVYVILNNGFYEGQQSHIAVEIMKNWCARAGVIFGMAIGQGAGEMLGFMEKVPAGHGPMKNLGRSMELLADCIRRQQQGETCLFSPNFPRFAWKLAANRTFWHPQARKNGLTKRDLLKKCK